MLILLTWNKIGINLGDNLQFCYYIILTFKMEGKKFFLTDKAFYLCSLAVELRDSVHPSGDVYIAKNSGRIYITSLVDVECLCYRIFDVINNHLIFEQNFCYQSHQEQEFTQQSFYGAWLESVQQREYQYDYSLFDCV